MPPKDVPLKPRILLLGPPRFIGADGGLIRLPPKAFALVAVTVLAGHAGVARAFLAELLWGATDRRSDNLRKLLWTIRSVERSHGPRLLSVDDTFVRFFRSDVTADLVDYCAVIDADTPVQSPELCRLYGGELLEGLELDCQDWSEWLAVRRTKLRDAFIASVSARLNVAGSLFDKEQRRVAAKRLLEIDPYNETACRCLMQIHAADGEVARVHDVYAGLLGRLETDLATGPATLTAKLFSDLMRGQDAPTGRPELMPASRAPASLFSTAIPGGPAQFRGNAVGGVPTLCVLKPTGLRQHGMFEVAASLIEDVTISLCRNKLIRVLAPHSAWRITSIDAENDVLASFGVDYAVETTLSFGSSLRLTVKLFDVQSRAIVWAEHFPFGREDIGRRHHDIATMITLSLLGQVERVEFGRYDPEHNSTAYYWYLVGQHSLRTLDLPTIRKGRRALKAAVETCSFFAPAVSALSRSYQMEWLLLARNEYEMLSLSKDLARYAIALDAQDSRGYRQLGFCQLYEKAFDACLESYDKAESLDPQHADLLADHANALIYDGQSDQAMAKMRRAMALNPLCPDYYRWVMARLSFFSGAYDDAIASIGAMKNPGPAYRLLAASHAMLGNRTEAHRFKSKAMEIHPDFTVSRWQEIIPLRDARQIERHAEVLRLAGFT